MINWQFILNPATDNLEVDEPTGWTDTTFEMKRDARFHGISVAYADNDLEFEGRAAQFLKKQYEAAGIDANVKILIRQLCDDDSVYEETFTLDFGTYKTEVGNKGCVVKISFEQGSCFALFNAGFDKRLDVETPTTFDGTTTPRQLPRLKQNVLIPAKAILKQFKGSAGKDNVVIVGDISAQRNATNTAYRYDLNLRPDFKNAVANSIDVGYLDNPPSAMDLGGWVSPLIRNEENATCIDNVFHYNYRFKGSFRIKSANGTPFRLGHLSHFIYKGRIGANGDPTDVVMLSQQTLVNADTTIDATERLWAFDFQRSGNIELKRDEFIYYVFSIYCVKNSSTFTPVITHKWDEETAVDIFINSKCPPTYAPLFKPFELFQRSADIITNNCLEVKSGYYNGGCGTHRMLTTGLHLRNAPDPKFFVSFKDLLDGFAPIDAVGFGFAAGADGKEVLEIEPIEHFYSNTEIFVAPEVESVRTSVNASEVIGKIRVGYDKWQAERINGLDEFNSTREYRTTVQNAKTAFDIVSKFIAGSYLIELARQQSYVETGKADTKNDNDIFILQCKNESAVNAHIGFMSGNSFIVERNTPFVTIGNTVSITGSTFNNGNFLITNIFTVFGLWAVVVDRPTVAESAKSLKLSLVSGSGAAILTVEEGANALTGVHDAGSVKNVRISPLRNLLRWWRYLAGRIFRNATEPGANLVFSSGTGNYEMAAFLSDLCSPESQTIKENINVNFDTLKAFLQHLPLIRAEAVSFDYPLDLDEFKRIRSNPYGFISYQDRSGVWRKGYINRIAYRIDKASATFELIPKYE